MYLLPPIPGISFLGLVRSNSMLHIRLTSDLMNAINSHILGVSSNLVAAWLTDLKELGWDPENKSCDSPTTLLQSQVFVSVNQGV